MLLRIRKSQSTLEYALVVSVIVGALIGLNTYMKRGVQGQLRESTDRIGDQFDPETFSTERTSTDSAEYTTAELRDQTTGELTTTIADSSNLVTTESDSWSSTE